MTVSTPAGGAAHSKSAPEVKKEFKHADSSIAPA
jgi:hypothetical protein